MSALLRRLPNEATCWDCTWGATFRPGAAPATCPACAERGRQGPVRVRPVSVPTRWVLVGVQVGPDGEEDESSGYHARRPIPAYIARPVPTFCRRCRQQTWSAGHPDSGMCRDCNRECHGGW